MIGKPVFLALAIILAAASTSLVAQTVSSGLRGSTPLNEEGQRRRCCRCATRRTRKCATIPNSRR
ncbi:hypothetical protein ONR75_26595 [Rhodopseudomonas sp. P2A-2r]|nr:hypothetical protein ONR75_26595 [Rhodopseudomonas sp. P2A-2r]